MKLSSAARFVSTTASVALAAAVVGALAAPSSALSAPSDLSGFSAAALATPTAPCRSGGPNAADAAAADYLNPRLANKMSGHMNAYRVSCAVAVTDAVKAAGLPDRAAVIALATVIVESSIQNYSEATDHDSLGLFQQRAGWGSVENRLNPAVATGKFLDKMQRLYPNGTWRTAPVGDVAQAVQQSAYPDRYQVEANDAAVIVGDLWNGRTGRPGDVNVDGWADVVARTGGGDLVAYLHSKKVDGVKTFRTPTVKVGHGWGGMSNISLGSVSAMGAADIVATDENGDMWVYRHAGKLDGEDTFLSRVKVSHGWGGMKAVMVADLDGKGFDDVLAIDGDGRLLLYPHSGKFNGESTFFAPREVGHGWDGMNAVAAEDVTGDGRADIIARNAAGDLLLYTALVSGDSFSFAGPVKVGHGWGGMSHIAFRDITGDDRADVVARDADDNLRVYAYSGHITGETTFFAGQVIGERWGGITAIAL